MKAKIYICFAVLVLLTSLLCILPPAQAQYSYDEDGKLRYASALNIISPANITYTTNQVYLNFTVKAQFDPNVANVTITYRLDNQPKITVPITFEFVPLWTNSDPPRHSSLLSYYLLSGCVELVDLPQGSHSLRIDAMYIDYARNDAYYDNAIIYFTIDGSSQITSNPEPQFTLNVDLDDSVCEMELPIKTIYACLSVISLVAIASFALFIKHKTQEKIK